MPTFRRIPKRGFSNFQFAVRFSIVNVGDLEERFAAGAHVTPQALLESGLVRHLRDPIKVLGDGALSKKLIVEAVKFSRSASEKIAALGGEARICKA